MEATPPAAELTRLLVESSRGDRGALDTLLPAVYDELRRLAGYYMSRERRDHTLQPTALVHEAYVRLIDQRQVDWKNRAQFLGLAAEMMRRVLLNHARDRGAQKRGAGAQKISLSALERSLVPQPDVDLIALDDALVRLTAIDARKGRIVELKFFGGLTNEEIGQVLQVSVATVERDWSFARAWLYGAVAGEGAS